MRGWRSVMLCAVVAALAIAAAPVFAQLTTVAPAPPEKPPGWGGGTEDLSGSVVVFDPVAGDTVFVTGTSQTFCFRAESFTADWEWAYSVWLRFPNDWTVTDVYVEGTPSCAQGGSFQDFDWNFQTSPYEVEIDHPRWHNNPTDHCTAHYCFEVTSGTGTPDAEVSWYWDGDGWGAAPNNPCSDDGYTPDGEDPCDEQIHPPAVIPAGDLDPILLTPASQTHAGCSGDLLQHTLTVMNNTGDAATVNLEYDIIAGAGTCSGPASVAVADGGSEVITVDFTPMGAPGETVTCEVSAEDAADPDNTSAAVIHRNLLERYFDPAGWQAEPIVDAMPHQWASGTVGTHPTAPGDVGYVVGGLGVTDQGVIANLQMFDPADETWTQLAAMPNPRFSTVVGWIDGLLYAAGGFDGAFVATDDLRVYDPATNTWDNTTPANMPAMRGGGAGGVGPCADGSGECLFHVGGGTDSSFANTTRDTWQYDPAEDTWTQLDDVPAGSSPDGYTLSSGVGCLGHIYFGGDFRGFPEFFRLDPTQPAGSQWVQLADVPAAAGKKKATFVCKEDWDAVMLVGGSQGGGWSGSVSAYVYDIATDTWEGPLAQTLAVAQEGAVGWHMDNKVWTSGGTVGSNAIDPMPFESIEQFTCDAPGVPAIALVKTVGTEPDVCATTTEITVNVGTTVYYCFVAENIGDVTLELHNLEDDQLGTILDGFPFVLAPGEFSPEVIESSTPTGTVTNTATWTAYNPADLPGVTGSASAQASATVNVVSTVTVTVEVGPDGGGTVTGGGVYAVGDDVTVQAFPSLGWVFLYWEINGTQITDNPYTFEVTEDITLTAVFEQQEIEAIPTTGTIGLVLLLALLAGVGVFVLRRM